MAQQRNHQLKVINQFGGGIQNIPADHLIQEDAYSSAINVNTKDSTLRPTRRGLIQGLGQYRTYLKENIDGTTTEIQIPSNISYINYANSLYYLKEAGSPLLKYTRKDFYDEALPQSKATLVVKGTGDTAGQTFKAILDKIDPIIREYVSNTKTPLRSTQMGRTGLFGQPDHAVLEAFKEKVQLLYDVDIGTITQDNLGLSLTSLQQTLSDIVTTAVEMKTKSTGELVTRLIAATTEPAFTQLNAGVVGSGEKHDVWVAMAKSKYTVSSGQYTRGKQNIVIGGLVKYIGEYIATLESLIETSAWMFVGSSTSHQWINDNGDASVVSSLWKSMHDTAKAQLIQAKSIQKRAQERAGTTPPPASIATDAQYYVDTLNQALPDANTRRTFVLFGLAIKQGLFFYTNSDTLEPYYSYIKSGVSTDTPIYSDSTMAQMNINMHSFNTQTSTLITKLEALDIATPDAIETNFAEYSLVIYDTVTKAYTEMVRSDLVYDKDGVTLTYDSTLDTTHWSEAIIYRRAKGDPQFTEIKRYGQNLKGVHITLHPPFTKGAVPITPYRVKEPPNDFTAIAEYKGAIFLARKNSEELWFTHNGRPDLMNALDFIKVPQAIKTIKSAGAGVFIWTTNDTLYLLTGLVDDGKGTNTLNLKRIADSTPILEGYGATSIDNLVIWISPHGIHNTSGYGSAESTANTWEFERKPIKCIASTVAHHKAYFLVKYGDNQNSIIEYDYATRQVMEHEASDIAVGLTVYDDDLYYVNTLDNITYSLHSFNRGTELIPYKASLKRFAGYSCDVRQRFTNINICHTAKPYKDIDRDEAMTSLVKVYVDDWLAGEETIVGTNVTRIDLPQTNNTGYSIRVEIEGTLGIKSIRTRYATIDWED